MKRFYHKLLSSIVSFMLIITASFVPELFNFSIANAVGNYEAKTGVYSLTGTSTNDHSDAYYVWEKGNTLFVAVSVNINSNQLSDVTFNGISASRITYLGYTDSNSKNPVFLKVFEEGNLGGIPILNVAPPSKTSNNPNSWVVAEFDLTSLPTNFRLSVLTAGGHAINNVLYTVVGALEVFHEYPPTDPALDGTQSFGSNTLGGIAADSYTLHPNPEMGFEYVSVLLKIDNVVVGTASVGTPTSIPFSDGTINVAADGTITLVLTKTSSKVYDFIYTYQLSDYLLTIHYEYEDGSTAAPDYTDTLNYQDPYSVVSPTIPGYTPSLATVSGTMPASNRTVTVTYTAIDYTFTFVPNWGSVLNEVRSFNVGGSVIPPVFTRDGYTFKGWTSDQAGLNLYVDGFTNLTVGNKTVYAQWEAIDYTFTFVPNWGSELSVDRIFNVGGSVIPPVFTRTGFTFTGWSLDVEGTQTYTQFSNLTSGNKTVYAQWSQNNYSFTFDPNFGDGANVVQMFNFGGSVAGTSFTRLGYTFDGWTLDEAGLIPYTGGLTNLPAEDIYVYAQWEAIDYTFTFDPNFGDGANVVQSFNVGGSVAGTV
ncbi:MAG: InlB B-repeat-containing protein, partial [Erysipelothrix sp.]|nr:InlB B-repeat-containing protein [Erysipelothrix sp.]